MKKTVHKPSKIKKVHKLLFNCSFVSLNTHPHFHAFATMLLLGAGLAGLAGLRKKSSRK